MEHEEAAETLGWWADQQGIHIDFDTRSMELGGNQFDIIFVLFTQK